MGPAPEGTHGRREAEVTIDSFIGGRVEAVQPAAGHHRSGLEAVMLGASLPAQTRGTVADLGAGVGVAGFCMAARCRDARVILIERDRTALDCARAALLRPANRAFAGRIAIVEADIAARPGLPPASADAVIFNPPFHDSARASASPVAARAGAHMLGAGGLDPWFRAAAGLLKPGGSATVIFRADGLDLVLAAARGRLGALDILPIAPRPGEAAHRILMRGIKGSRAGLRLLPPLILHNEQGNGFRPEVDALLREGADLAAVAPQWQPRSHGHPSHG
jgi:tRNA1(Val) A37 N6-methylase TrmN6